MQVYISLYCTHDQRPEKVRPQMHTGREVSWQNRICERRAGIVNGLVVGFDDLIPLKSEDF